MDEKGLVHIVFDLYDEDQDGSIDFDDLFRLLVDCYGKEHMENENIQRIMQKAQDNGPMNRQQFMAFTARSPQTLKQIIDMQQRVREETLGHKAWMQLEKKRQLKTDALFRPVSAYTHLCEVLLRAFSEGDCASSLCVPHPDSSRRGHTAPNIAGAMVRPVRQNIGARYPSAITESKE